MYEQLSMFDIVLEQPKQEDIENMKGGKSDVLAALPLSEDSNLCPYKIPTVDEIAKLIEKSAYGTDKTRLLSNVLECGAISISNAVDKSQSKEREKRFSEIINAYKESDRKSLCEIFARIFALCSSVVYDDGAFNDNLGELFMRLDQGNKHTGQFFTPYHISKFMAECALLEDYVKEKTANDGIITICDPCSGGGGMMMAALSTLKDYGVNYTRNCFVECADIDIRCVHMTYIQLALAGVPAIIKHQNSLTRELWSIWRTPAFMFQYTRFCQYEKYN